MNDQHFYHEIEEVLQYVIKKHLKYRASPFCMFLNYKKKKPSGFGHPLEKMGENMDLCYTTYEGLSYWLHFE